MEGARYIGRKERFFQSPCTVQPLSSGVEIESSDTLTFGIREECRVTILPQEAQAIHVYFYFSVKFVMQQLPKESLRKSVVSMCLRKVSMTGLGFLSFLIVGYRHHNE
jgi:hypothetical protein